MRRFDPRVIWGLLLIAGGVLFLLQSLGLFRGGDAFWALVLGAAGLVFLSVPVHNRAHWWALIPGLTLLGVAALISLSIAAPGASEQLGGTIVLGSIALSFWAIYLLHREQWWAVIPGGVLATLAVVAGWDAALQRRGVDTGGVFMLGLGLTFALVALLPAPDGRMRWAWFPAAILIVLGVVILAGLTAAIDLLWPLGLIVIGLYLIGRTLARRRES